MMRVMITAGLCVALMAASASAQEFTTNGGFETGDTTGWTSFAIGSQTFAITGDANTGSFAGELFNDFLGQPLAVKQANIGVGSINPGDAINISFAAKGSGTVGGEAFAEFFSELAGGGVSSTEILGGGPLALTNTYQTFNFSAVAGPDVSGGVTLQFNAAAGAAIGSTSRLFIDDVSVSLLAPPLDGDANGDGFVGVDDLNIVLGNWNAGTPPVAPGPDLLSDFSSFSLDVEYGDWVTATFTSGATDFRVESAGNHGGGGFTLTSPLDATGETSLEVQLDVNAANVSSAFNVVLIDGDGTEQIYRFTNLVVGDDQTFDKSLDDSFGVNFPGTVAGLDLSTITTFHLQGTFDGAHGAEMDLTFDNLALTGGTSCTPLGPADINGDCFVGVDDLNIILGNWNAGTPPGSGAVIPEPATLSLISLGGLTMLRRRR